MGALIGARASYVSSLEDNLRHTRRGDYFISQDPAIRDERLVLVRTVGSHTLYRRTRFGHPSRRPPP